MKTSSLGRTARLRAAVDRYEALDFDEPHRKSVRNTAPKCARQSRMPRPSHGLAPISIPRRQYKLNQRYMKTCQPTHAHTRVRSPDARISLTSVCLLRLSLSHADPSRSFIPHQPLRYGL
jgi:hypothetical protein